MTPVIKYQIISSFVLHSLKFNIALTFLCTDKREFNHNFVVGNQLALPSNATNFKNGKITTSEALQCDYQRPNLTRTKNHECTYKFYNSLPCTEIISRTISTHVEVFVEIYYKNYSCISEHSAPKDPEKVTSTNLDIINKQVLSMLTLRYKYSCTNNQIIEIGLNLIVDHPLGKKYERIFIIHVLCKLLVKLNYVAGDCMINDIPDWILVGLGKSEENDMFETCRIETAFECEKIVMDAELEVAVKQEKAVVLYFLGIYMSIVLIVYLLGIHFLLK